MVQAVELTFDRTTDERVRAEWAALQEAGLPSLADHTGATNRPHVTLHVRDRVDATAERGLEGVVRRLPLRLHLGPLVLFHARRRWVVARLVTVDRALLELHEEVSELVGGGGSPLTEPGSWVPHVSLARGVRDEQVGAVLGVLADAPPYAARALRLRRWDQPDRRAWDVGQPGQTSAGLSL